MKHRPSENRAPGRDGAVLRGPGGSAGHGCAKVRRGPRRPPTTTASACPRTLPPGRQRPVLLLALAEGNVDDSLLQSAQAALDESCAAADDPAARHAAGLSLKNGRSCCTTPCPPTSGTVRQPGADGLVGVHQPHCDLVPCGTGIQRSGAHRRPKAVGLSGAASGGSGGRPHRGDDGMKLKKRLAALAATAVLATAFCAPRAGTAQPHRGFYVNDSAGVLDEATERQIVEQNDGCTQPAAHRSWWSRSTIPRAWAPRSTPISWAMSGASALRRKTTACCCFFVHRRAGLSVHSGLRAEDSLSTMTLSRILQEDLEPDLPPAITTQACRKPFDTLYRQVCAIYGLDPSNPAANVAPGAGYEQPASSGPFGLAWRRWCCRWALVLVLVVPRCCGRCAWGGIPATAGPMFRTVTFTGGLARPRLLRGPGAVPCWAVWRPPCLAAAASAWAEAAVSQRRRFSRRRRRRLPGRRCRPRPLMIQDGTAFFAVPSFLMQVGNNPGVKWAGKEERP